MQIFKELTKFEWFLWITSLLIVTISYIFVPDQNVITIFTCIIGITALIFCAKGFVIGQVLILVFSILYSIISFCFAYYGEMLTYLCLSSPAAVCAIVSWIKHPYKQTKQVEIQKMTQKQYFIMFFLTVIVTFTFYFVLKALNNANLALSTVSVATSCIAAYLVFMRSPYYAVGYAMNDIILIILWVLATIENVAYTPMIACFIVFLINDLYAFVNWKKMEKKQIM
ncbi:MAG: nicotinamide mononucleotide transporter [Clostridiales bacterium]|nr:nicotinamide mononucleotide transporter [Clostridiales bacterium]